MFVGLRTNSSAYLELRDTNGYFHAAQYTVSSESPAELRVGFQLLEIYSLILDYYALNSEA